MIAIPCVIFAGGKSSRMGEDKALLPFADSPTLTEFQYKRLKKIFTHVYISCKDSTKFHFDADFIYDNPNCTTYAPTLGFIATFDFLTSDSFFAISVDSPFVTQSVIETLVLQDSDKLDATIATTQDKLQPLCGIYHRSLAKKFLQMQKENTHTLGKLLKSSNTHFVNFVDDNTFLNLNNHEEYKKAITLV